MKVERPPLYGETLQERAIAWITRQGIQPGRGQRPARSESQLVARIGEDAFGEMALSLYRDEASMCLRKTNRRRAYWGGFIMVEAASGNNCIVNDPGANELLTPIDILQVFKPPSNRPRSY